MLMKMIVVGDSFVGKSAIVGRFVNLDDPTQRKFHSTIGKRFDSISKGKGIV